MTAIIVKTKKGNRNFSGLKSKETSKARYGIIINYSDWRARFKDLPVTLDNNVYSVKDLYFQHYDTLKGYMQKSAFGYIQRKEVLINPIGELRAYRYSLTDKGKKRYLELKKKYK